MKYYLREWREVTKEEFIQAEANAGFHSKTKGEPATGGFSGSTGLEGRVEYDKHK